MKLFKQASNIVKEINQKNTATQRAVLRNGGRNSSKILLYLQRQWLVRVAVETRHCCKAASTLHASGGLAPEDKSL